MAIQLEPDNAAAYVNRGSAKGQINQLLEAIADYNHAIRLRPDYALAYYNRGSTKVTQKLFKDARADLHTALELAQADGNNALVSDIEKLLQKRGVNGRIAGKASCVFAWVLLTFPP